MEKLTLTKTTDRKIYNSLLRWYSHASAEEIQSGIDWYSDAQQFTRELAEEYSICAFKTAAVVSALSPNNKWPRNKIDAAAIIHAVTNNLDTNAVKVCTYNNNKNKAIDILKGDVALVSKSPKTYAFSMNIGLLSNSHVTVDKWHIRACLARPEQGKTATIETVTPVQYKRVEAITVKLARELNLKAYELQAIIWLTIRSQWGFTNA